MPYSDHSAKEIPGNLPRARLLVVDDDPYMRELYALVLNLEGYAVQTACDGAEALEMLAAEPFDLVLTDRSMPNLGGESMVLAMRSSGIAIPVIMVSGSLTHLPMSPGVTREIFTTIIKPASAGKILSAVANALHGPAQSGRQPQPGNGGEHAQELPAAHDEHPRHKSSLAIGWSKIFTSVVLHLRPVAKSVTPAHPRFSAPIEQLVSHTLPQKNRYGR